MMISIALESIQAESADAGKAGIGGGCRPPTSRTASNLDRHPGE